MCVELEAKKKKKHEITFRLGKAGYWTQAKGEMIGENCDPLSYADIP